MTFDPASVKTFRFVSYNFNENNGTAQFYYAFDNGPLFIEELVFHEADLPLSHERREALNRCLQALYLVSGVSYYKAAIPPKITIESFNISELTANFFEKLYFHGLGEFSYHNCINLHEYIHFPCSKFSGTNSSEIKLPRKTIIPIGGGKDSVITLEALKHSDEPIILYSLGAFATSQKIAKIAKIPIITVSRKLSPILFELNSQGALNGHIPISAIIAFTLPVMAILYGFDTAALSNERSANVGNLNYNGIEINHQYSKGLEFEQDIARYFKECLLFDLQYFSFLRPLSDLGIARLFSKRTSYHSVFSSCNAAYRIHAERRTKRWCLNCPKCRFTFLSLAPFMEKKELINIFSENLLEDARQLSGFDELFGLKGNRPFECVGEEKESIAALALLVKKPEWRDDLIVKRLNDLLLPKFQSTDELIKKELDFSKKHRLPYHYEKVLLEFIEKST